MEEREDLEAAEGDSASIILTPPRRVRTAPMVPPPVPKPEEFSDVSEEAALSKEQTRKKLEISIVTATSMSRNRSFPEDVRKKFLEKIKGYKKELSSL